MLAFDVRDGFADVVVDEVDDSDAPCDISAVIESVAGKRGNNLHSR